LKAKFFYWGLIILTLLTNKLDSASKLKYLFANLTA